MAAKSFVRLVGAKITRIFGVVVSAGSANDGDFPALDAAGKLDVSMMPTGVGVNTKSAVASEALAANDLVDLWNNAGTLNVRKADATIAGKLADGFVKSGVASGASALVYLAGNVITGLSGLTPGTSQYLSTTAGLRTEDVSAYVAGNVVMPVGYSLSATDMMFEPLIDITL